jgi:hypothetical protein
MSHHLATPIRRAALAIALAIALLVASVGAAHATGPQTTAQRKCTSTYYNALGQLGRVGSKAFGACLLLHAQGKLGELTLADCVELPNERFDAAFGRVEAALAKSCDGVDKDGLPKAPAFGTTEAPSALDLAIAAASGIFGGTAETFGFDLDEAFVDFATDKTLARCQLDVDRRQAACRAGYLATFAACARTGLRGTPAKGIEPFVDAEDLATCIGSDPKGRIARLCSRDGAIGTGFAKACLGKGVDPALAVPACAATGADARDCISRVATCHACLSVTAAADLQPSACAPACVAP